MLTHLKTPTEPRLQRTAYRRMFFRRWLSPAIVGSDFSASLAEETNKVLGHSTNKVVSHLGNPLPRTSVEPGGLLRFLAKSDLDPLRGIPSTEKRQPGFIDSGLVDSRVSHPNRTLYVND